MHPRSKQPHSTHPRSMYPRSSIHIHTIQRLGRYRQAGFSRSLPPLPCNRSLPPLPPLPCNRSLPPLPCNRCNRSLPQRFSRSLPPRHTFLTGLICPPLSKFDKIVKGL
jgi:hypothetical protein